jgi:acyl-CoA thioesterase YciA
MTSDPSRALAPPESEAVIRVIAMPADTNPHGDIFGGWLMSMMDLAAGSAASRYSAGRTVTVAVEAMAFHHPVSVGDEVSVYAEILSTGRTSMKIAVEAWRRKRASNDYTKVTHATFTFVAIDDDSRPRALGKDS